MKDKFFLLTFSSALAACLIGLVYLVVSGAPNTMLIVNGAAAMLGISLAIAAIHYLRITHNFVTMVSLVSAFALLGTAIFGYAIEDARRWALVGPFFIQVSLVLLPLIALSFARLQNFWTTLAVIVACIAMALQPDRAMAAMLSAAVAVVCWLRPSKLSVGALIVCFLGFLVTLLLPDKLPAAPYVDHILWTAFDINIIVGLSLWLGCLALITPIFFLPGNERSVIHYTFAASWFVIIAAAAMGAYPTPIVGYGASAIIGYFLSLIFMQPVGQMRSVEGPGAADQADSDREDLSLRSYERALAA